ncbi:MAG TPA: DHA2 family efflux MFS transporter permease subunit [Candidatus Dormibacteraeota bacterium]|nr:DHA2 family efflux MFS transporter permease subunit [Candidatus Dormibacteraeota bacterium]
MSARRRAGERLSGTTLLPLPGAPASLDDSTSRTLPLGSPRPAPRPPRRAVHPRRTVHRPVRPLPRPVPTPAPAPAPAAAAVPAGGGWLVPLLVVMIGSFMALLDTSIVNVATSRIQADFGASTDQVQWIATGYSLALGIVVPTSGWLGDRFGLRPLYIGSLLAFVGGSALCGIAWNLNTLIVFRVVQAIGGGLLPVLAQSIIYRLVPRDRIGSAMGLYGLGIVVAPAIGPALGGWLVEYVNWRLIFYINVPIGILGALAALSILPHFAKRPGQRFDLLGFLFVGSGLFALLLAFSEGSSWGWTSYRVLMLIAGGLLSLAIFVVVELSVEQPLLDLRIFGSFGFSVSSVLIGLISTGLFAGAFYVPLFLQQGEGYGPFQAGLTLLLPAAVMSVMMPISGRLYDRIGARWPGAIGLLLVALGTYLLRDITPETSRSALILVTIVRNIGIGLAMMPIMTGAMAVVRADRVGAASAINNIVQRVASALGLAVLTSVLIAHQAQQVAARSGLLPSASPGFPDLSHLATQGQAAVLALLSSVQNQAFGGALGDVFLLTAGLTAIGVLLALLLPGAPAHAAKAAKAAGADEGTTMHEMAA